MVCKNCGKEMIKVGTLLEKEVEELAYIERQNVNATQALNYDTINKMKFEDGQVFEYFRAAFENKAQAEFLSFVFFRDLRKRLELKTNNFVIGDGTPDNHDVFVHPEEDNDKE